ncbi:hypothetical protein [Paenibacillus sp. TSA_86.1]
MSTKKKPVTERFPEVGKPVSAMIYYMSVNAESFIDKDRHYPLG